MIRIPFLSFLANKFRIASDLALALGPSHDQLARAGGSTWQARNQRVTESSVRDRAAVPTHPRNDWIRASHRPGSMEDVRVRPIDRLMRVHKFATTWRATLCGVVIGLIGTALVGVFDFFTGTEVSFALLYLLPIGFCTSYCGWWPGAFLSLVSALVWFSVDHLGGAVYSQPLIPIWNAFVRLGFFLITSYLLARVRFYRNHLEATVRERTAQLEREVIRRKTLEREMVELQHREQQRFAHELHDTLGSYLAGIAFRAKIVSEQLGQRNAPEFSASAELVQLINSGVAKARQFSRLLAPIACGKNDLGSALSHLAAEVESFYGITCSVSTALDLPKLTSEQAQELCRITQEAVRNAIQHAHADRIDIKMNFDENALYVTIENEGKPWEPSINWTSRGLGLRIMNHRSERIGAKLSIRKGAHSGTCVTCRLPRTETVPDGRSKGETAPQPGVDPSGKKKERDHRLPTSVRVRTA